MVTKMSFGGFKSTRPWCMARRPQVAKKPGRKTQSNILREASREVLWEHRSGAFDNMRQSKVPYKAITNWISEILAKGPAENTEDSSIIEVGTTRGTSQGGVCFPLL